MASSINDLERLSLDLPDVVVEAEKVEKPKRGRGRRCLRRNLQKSQPQSQQSQQQGGARALTPVEDKRVPDSSIVEAVQEPKPKPEPNDRGPPIQADRSEEPITTKKTGGRSKRNRKRGKRKPESVVPNPTSSQDNKENQDASKADVMDDWMADNSDDDEPKYIWRNVTKNGDIKKCILVDGKMDQGRPKAGDTVLVKVQGKLKDGTIIDDYPTMVFNVGEYEVIDGLDLVVQSMYRNELSIVSIKPEMAYGAQGRGTRAPCGKVEENSIPGNARITYLFGLLHFEKAKDISTLTWAQRRKTGQQRLRLANWWYQRKEYPIAVKCYRKALQYYNDIPTNRECASAEEYKELLQLMEERLRVMRQVANIFRRISNLIQCGQISV